MWLNHIHCVKSGYGRHCSPRKRWYCGCIDFPGHRVVFCHYWHKEVYKRRPTQLHDVYRDSWLTRSGAVACKFHHWSDSKIYKWKTCHPGSSLSSSRAWTSRAIHYMRLYWLGLHGEWNPWKSIWWSRWPATIHLWYHSDRNRGYSLYEKTDEDTRWDRYFDPQDWRIIRAMHHEACNRCLCGASSWPRPRSGEIVMESNWLRSMAPQDLNRLWDSTFNLFRSSRYFSDKFPGREFLAFSRWFSF